MASDPSDLERWRRQYRHSRAAVDGAFAQELARMTEDEGLKRAQSLRLFDTAKLPSRESSGLVAQQALFQKLRPR